MRLWLVGDTHFGYKNGNQQWLEDMIGYFENVVIPTIKENKQPDDILIHLGDVFDNRTSVNVLAISKVQKMFEHLSEVIPVKVLVGNHDIFNKSTNDVTSVDVLKNMHNVEIYKEPVVENLGGKKCLLLPWRRDSEADKEALKKYAGNDYIFCHMDINGASMTRGTQKSDSCVQEVDFSSSQVYSGHIHLKQDYGNIHYIGSPYELTRNDSGNTKYLQVLDLENNQRTMYENTYNARFISCSFDEIKVMFDDDIEKVIKNNFVDLHVNIKDSNSFYTDEFTQKMEKFAKDCTIHIDDEENVFVYDQDSDENTKTIKDKVFDFIGKQYEKDDRLSEINQMVKGYFEKINE